MNNFMTTNQILQIKFLDRHNLPKLVQEEIIRECIIELYFKTFHKKKPDDFTGEFHQLLKEYFQHFINSFKTT